MKSRIADLLKQGDALYSKRQPLLNLWQEVAEHVFPERADFTTMRSISDDYAGHLMTGFPSMCRRDLANQFASMLRPRGKQWFELTVDGEDDLDANQSVKAYLEYQAKVMLRAMYDREARFTRATNEGDHDFATFGNAVLTVEANAKANGLLYRTWHLRDVVWAENAEGEIDKIHRKCKWTARQLKALFPKTCGPKVEQALKKEPDKEFECRHIILPTDEYDYTGEKKVNSAKTPFMSIYVDKDNDHVLEETAVIDHPYVIPRWQTVSGSQYARSPATTIALIDSRLLQQMTLTLLEAGEKAVNPPLVIQDGVVMRDDVQIYAGGTTYIDREYDEQLGDAIRVLDTGAKGGLAFGKDIIERYEALIKEAFYLNKINLPEPGKDMTAYETRKRVEEYVRSALPLFEPMEMEYNGALCDKTFGVLMRHGAFGPIDQMPKELGGANVEFKFASPLQEAAERDKVVAFQEAAQLAAIAAQIDPSIPQNETNWREAYRDAFSGAGTPASWLIDNKKALEAQAAAQKQQQIEKAAQAVSAGAGIGQQVGDAAQSLQAAGLVPQAGTAAPLEGAVAA
jgi:hypothetical protein